MRVLIFGRNGQVGRELARASWPRDCSLKLLDRADCDLADATAVGRAVRETRPAVVINAAAYTAVDRAESEPDVARSVNCDAPQAMARSCEEAGAALIHLSTDYVFDGLKTSPYLENDPMAPLSVYGRSKAEGEVAIREALRRHIIVRTSWVFAAHGANFVRTVLRLADERPELRIVCDQTGAPTAAGDIALAITSIVQSLAEDKPAWGTFHFSSGKSTSWYEFARAIVGLAGKSARVVPIATDEYKTAARRPQHSVLDCSRLTRHYGIAQPTWRRALSHVLAELQQGDSRSSRR